MPRRSGTGGPWATSQPPGDEGPLPVRGRATPSSRAATHAPELVPYEEAHTAADPLTRLKAHALTVVLAVVPASCAVFAGITRRLQVGDAVFLQRRTASSPMRARWRRYLLEVQPHDPLAARRVADSSATVLTLEDAGRGNEPGTPYAHFLDDAGIADVATVYLRSAGAIVGAIAVVRDDDEARFSGHEVMLLRRLQPLLEHAYVYAREPAPDAPRPDALATAGLTPREMEVAQLVAIGSTNAEIARALHMSLATVKTHLTQIYAKLGLRSRTQLAILVRPQSG